MYQTFKFFVVRAGISLFMMLTFGFFGLYFFHEIALAGVHLDDKVLHWLFGGIFVFFGFIGFGMWGEYRFEKSFRRLNDLASPEDEELINRQYKNLIDFTFSSHFLSGKARLLRSKAILDYADYLHYLGKDDPAALKIYLKAFLLEPETSRFRLPLLSALKQVKILEPSEIDLLLVMFRSAKYPDHSIASHLANILIEQKRFSRQTETIFLTALDNSPENSNLLISFVLPKLLKKNRSDEFALKFYLSALEHHSIEEERLRVKLATAYCDGLWRTVDPILHKKCGIVYHDLPEAEQELVLGSVRETRISEKWKQLKLFGSDDLKGLRNLQVRLGILQTCSEVIKEWNRNINQMLKGAVKKPVLAILKGLIRFSYMPPNAKFGSFIGFGILLAFTIGYLIFEEVVIELGDTVVRASLSKSMLKNPKINDREFTLQIAAVTSQKHAERMVRKLESRGLKGVYIIKSARRSSGFWYKIRVGKFYKKSDAYARADLLMRERTIRNYFIISYSPQIF